jgi:hypothetical protein
MTYRLPSALLLFSAIQGLAATFTIPAPSQPKANQVVEVTDASLDRTLSYVIATQTAQGVKLLPAQWDAQKEKLSFILPYQDSGKAFTGFATIGKPKSPIEVQALRGKDTIEVSEVGETARTIFRYQDTEILPTGVKELYRRGGFIHPIYTPEQTLVSDSFPSDHFHHHGIWMAWSHTSFQGRKPDFWNVHENTGRVAALGVDRVWSGPVEGGFTAKLRSLDTGSQPPVPVLDEAWTVRCYAGGPNARANVFDVESTQKNIATDPLELTKHIYGGLGFRGRADWDAKAKLRFLTSEGVTDRLQGNGQRTRWFYFGGPADGQTVGVAILCHPDNLNAPQATRFNPTMPFVAYTPAHAGDTRIAPGAGFTQKFRFVVFSGEPDPLLLESYWQGFAGPASVTVK